MKKGFKFPVIALLTLCTFMSCKEDNETYDAYANWPARNADYFTQIASEARNAIATAKATHGDQWEEHCEWRMFKSTTKAPQTIGALTDSICVHIEARGNGTTSPAWSDTVRIHYRGYLMPTQNYVDNEWVEEQKIFSQSFIGDLNQATAVPSKMCVSDAVHGFATALQWMHPGDAWTVYIPSELAYGQQETGEVKSYSTLRFYINMVDFYRVGIPVPDWK